MVSKPFFIQSYKISSKYCTFCSLVLVSFASSHIILPHAVFSRSVAAVLKPKCAEMSVPSGSFIPEMAGRGQPRPAQNPNRPEGREPCSELGFLNQFTQIVVSFKPLRRAHSRFSAFLFISDYFGVFPHLLCCGKADIRLCFYMEINPSASALFHHAQKGVWHQSWSVDLFRRCKCGIQTFLKSGF